MSFVIQNTRLSMIPNSFNQKKKKKKQTNKQGDRSVYIKKISLGHLDWLMYILRHLLVYLLVNSMYII